MVMSLTTHLCLPIRWRTRNKKKQKTKITWYLHEESVFDETRNKGDPQHKKHTILFTMAGFIGGTSFFLVVVYVRIIAWETTPPAPPIE